MTAAPLLACAILGALSFVQQDMAGLRVEAANELTGTTAGAFRQTDLDGDGLMDLVLPDAVALQRDGQFPDDTRYALPALNRHPLCDVWKQSLYFLYEDGLEIFAWHNGKLISTSQEHCAWPTVFNNTEFEEIEARNLPYKVRFRRFLFDLNGDGTPEIVLTQDKGLAIFSSTRKGYEQKAEWAIFPPSHITPTTQQALWPRDKRRLSFPTRQMSCLYYLDGRHVTVLQQVPANGNGLSRFKLSQYALEPTGLDLAKEKPRVTRTPPLPSWLQPCRLNDSAQPAFAGGRLLFSEASVIPMPLFETCVTTDGGKTKQVFRAQYIRPQCLFVDMNNDGRRDLISEHTGMFSGGPRETIARAMTSTRVEHTVEIHYQDSQGRFATEASCTVHFTIHLAHAPYRGGPMWQLYRRGALVNCTGDLNGDGLRDIVVHDRRDRLSVYLNRGGHFNKTPSSTIAVDHPGAFSLMDLNGDGKSDVIVPVQQGGEAVAHLYLSREVK